MAGQFKSYQEAIMSKALRGLFDFFKPVVITQDQYVVPGLSVGDVTEAKEHRDVQGLMDRYTVDCSWRDCDSCEFLCDCERDRMDPVKFDSLNQCASK